MTMLQFMFVVVVAFCALPTSEAVDRTKFKSCEQSSFCQRHRNQQSYEQQWTLDMSTLKQKDKDVTGQLLDQKNPSVRLQMILSLTGKGAIRMKIDELSSTRKRFEAKDSLDPNLTFQELRLTEITSERCEFHFGTVIKYPDSTETNYDGVYKLILYANPFKAEVKDHKDRTVVAMNSRGLMRFEDHKEVRLDKQMFGMPKASQAYDEAGRPVGETEQPQSDQPQVSIEEQSANSDTTETKSYAETFSTFTDSRPYGPMSVGVDLYFPNSDHIYGIPEHADSFSLRDTRPNIGDPYRLYNVDIFEYELNSPMSLYGAIPFMMAQSKTIGTFGIFWLNPSETWIDIESNHSQSKAAGVVDMISSFVSSDKKMSGRFTHWFSETGLIDIWFMPGPDPVTLTQYNAEIFGTVPMPPVYSMGFHQCRWNYYSGDEVMQVDREYDNANIPLDAIWLDIEYTTGRSKKYFTWDENTFPNHVELANNLTAKGRRLIAIIDPHIKKEDGYSVYDEGTAMDNWVKDAGNNPYDAWCWPGSSMWPDYLSPRVREWWSGKFDPAYFPGDKDCAVDIWNDMNEPSVFSGPEVTAPRDLKHVDEWEHRDIHNAYGFYMTKATYEGMAKHRSHVDRPFILTRSFFAGSQRYAAAWTGDNQASWDHLKITVPMLLSLSISGMPFVGADVGGFFNNPESEELVIRWHQAGAFQPFFRNHAHHDTRHREAYLFKGQTRDLLRNAISLRYSYMIYWYTCFFEAHIMGMPMMRPVWFHDTTDEKAYDSEYDFLVGKDLLVSLVLDKGVTTKDVYLPGKTETWYDLNTNVMRQGGQTVNMPVDIGTVPLFQRAGTIIPRQYRLRRSVEYLMKEPISLDIVLGMKHGKRFAQGRLFLDQYKRLEPDGTSATMKDVIYVDDLLQVRPSTKAIVSHGRIERIVIYNWPSDKIIRSIKVAPEELKGAKPETLSFKMGPAKEDGTSLLEIRKPQVSDSWNTFTMKIDIAS